MKESNENTRAQTYIPTDADYEKAEMDLLRAALKRTHKERFLMMTSLMKAKNKKFMTFSTSNKISMKEKNQEENINELQEEQAAYTGFVNISEDEKLKRNIFRSPMEKLSLFTRMLRREALYKNAKIIQK